MPKDCSILFSNCVNCLTVNPLALSCVLEVKTEFIDICESMVETGIKPDFITVDGAEGGTGAAPIDFSNYVGMPWEDALIFVVDTLTGYDLKKDIQIITATKIITAFDIFKAFALEQMCAILPGHDDGPGLYTSIKL